MHQISLLIVSNGSKSDAQTSIANTSALVDEVIIIDLYDNMHDLNCDSHISCVGNSIRKSIVVAEGHAKQPWILCLFAGEVLSAELLAEIDYLFRSQLDQKYIAYKFNITCCVGPQQPIDIRFAPSLSAIRLYSLQNITAANFNDPVEMYGTMINLSSDNKNLQLLTLNSKLYQYCFNSLQHSLRFLYQYTDIQAQELREAGYSASWWQVLRSVLCVMPWTYLCRRFCVLGIRGLMYSIYLSFVNCITQYKCYDNHTQQPSKASVTFKNN